ncbi:MAG: prenyltransferase/squalene oxidase repeat-containing protein [Planctomycetota bacterium]
MLLWMIQALAVHVACVAAQDPNAGELPAKAPTGAGATRSQQDSAERSRALRSEIDRMIHQLARTPRGDALEAAQFLVALARCHRRYDLQDGPLVKRPLELIWKQRRNDGLWGTSEKEIERVTPWVHQALAEIDREHHVDDLRVIERSYSRRFRLSGKALEKALRPYDPTALARLSEEGSVPRQKLTGKLAQLLYRIAEWELRQHVPASDSHQAWEGFQQKALDWLLATQEGGIWKVPGPGGKLVPEPGTTALCLAALASKPASERTDSEEQILNKGSRFLLASQNEDGSFSTYLPNYMTCVAVMALSRSGLPGTREALAKAQSFLLAIQNVEGREYRIGDRDYGSIGYGGDQRGDVSNSQMAIEALRSTGLTPEHEAIQKALVFLRRSQNLPGKEAWSGSRTTEDGRKVQVRAGSDGGAVYYPGNSPFGYDETAEGHQIARSYGSMTYALLKCYILAGLPRDDPRLKAALNWCLMNFTLDENPGAKPDAAERTRYQGLYYYYLTLARAFSLAGVQVEGRDWRRELRKKLKSLQKPDGAWVNDRNGRWWEDRKLICTAYALLALAE